MSIVVYKHGDASEQDIKDHLQKCDNSFIPPLSSRVDLKIYSKKIKTNAITFEAWASGELVGLVAAYCNNPEAGTGFITSVSVIETWKGKGIPSKLLKNCAEHTRSLGFQSIRLKADPRNMPAIGLYEKSGYIRSIKSDKTVILELNL